MPTRLSATDRRQQILEVASAMFARNGYQGTTTREIAEQAGINEALLFRHFPSKENLYWTLIEELCNARGRRHRVKRILELGGSDAEVFEAVACEFLTRTERDRELTRLLWFTALENHELSARFFNAFVAEYFDALAGHIRARIRQGAFRKTDPLLAARGFLGMIVYHFLIQEFFGGEGRHKFEARHVAQTLTQIWLAGMTNPVAGNGTTNRHHVRSGKKTNEN
ncbi:MAG TPA: TetR/AcrR family transcriptional regulator [Candidatus Acidoferrales bacterium]|jgi:AcrR family transcriptional regulator|nr:TetR/AcrR family transcriptional regulator [Candidatus Acidoferrales bacterium]